jgi:DNA polymerase-1
MTDILRETGTEEYKAFLTGENNFRYKVFPEYKAFRLNKPKPIHLAACNKHLVENWKAVVTDGYEADDALGIEQMALSHETDATCIASIDKDLLTIPGKHYNFVKKEWHLVSPSQARHRFYTSLIVGDSADGIKGAIGIGPKKAETILMGCETEEEYYSSCLNFFSCEEELLLNARCLYIWQKENDWWNPPAMDTFPQT